jgi:hypothetical protein
MSSAERAEFDSPEAAGPKKRMQAARARVIGEGTGCEICSGMCEGADCKISSGRARARARTQT